MQELIIFEDENYLVINKPAGLLVQPNKYQTERTLADYLKIDFPEIGKIGDPNRPGIVHRLDRDVSGLMVIAKTQKAYDSLIEQFKQHQIKKEYIGLAEGHPKNDHGTINFPIARTDRGKLLAVTKSSGELKDSKEALTEYEIMQKFQDYTLLKITPHTGRTNQIRIHLKAINCPLAGDIIYQNKNSRAVSLGRVFLHASRLGWRDLDGNSREYRLELPKDLQDFLEQIR